MKVGIVFGAFDLLHAGHINFLAQSRKKCDKLLVGLQVDPTATRNDKNKPIELLLERFIKLRGCKFVDEVIPYQREEDIAIMIQVFGANIRFLGSDYLPDASGKRKPIAYEKLIPITYIDSLPIHTTDLTLRVFTR
jgi:glycerol-3-phosphate cytidylyltransferase